MENTIVKKVINYDEVLENNDVKFYNLEVENDFNEAQSILNLSSYTTDICVDSAYIDRIENAFVGTYKVGISRYNDFNKFLRMVENERSKIMNEIYAKFETKKRKFLNENYYIENRVMSSEEARKALDVIHSEYIKESSEHKINKINIDDIDIDAWKNNKLKNGRRLGKELFKAGYSKELIDFYSLQIKDEKEIYLTISDRVQHIAGMSYFAEENKWDGFGVSSCQDPRNDNSESICLGGALHDSKLFVGMLHDKLEDLNDFDGKLLARTLFRYYELENGIPILIPCNYYGNNATKDMLHNVLKKIEGIGVFSTHVKNYEFGNDCMTVEADVEGGYNMAVVEDVYICESIDEYVEVDCPLCGGSGDYEVETSNGSYVTICCPSCNGDGEITANVYVDVDEYVEVETEEEILPYVEGYRHFGNKVKNSISRKYVNEALGLEEV